MDRPNLTPLSTADLDFKAALEADAAAALPRLGFDDRVGRRRRLTSLIHEGYVLELMVIAQMARWFEIGLVTPQELAVPHPTALMIDLRARIAASPREHVRSPAADFTLVRMMNWWQENTVTSAWRSLKAHIRVTETSMDLADAVADFLWNARDFLDWQADGAQP